MPIVFTHIFVAGTLAKTGFMDEKLPMRFWILTAVCSILPDIDILGFYLGIRHWGTFGHRGFFHSLTFALIAAIAVVELAFPAILRFSRRWWAFLVFFFAVVASHGVLDSMADKGTGVGFFIPFDNTRYYMPWRPVLASPMSLRKLFSSDGLEVLARVLVSEILWIWLPMIGVYLTTKALKKRTVAARGAAE